MDRFKRQDADNRGQESWDSEDDNDEEIDHSHLPYEDWQEILWELYQVDPNMTVDSVKRRIDELAKQANDAYGDAAIALRYLCPICLPDFHEAFEASIAPDHFHLSTRTWGEVIGRVAASSGSAAWKTVQQWRAQILNGDSDSLLSYAVQSLKSKCSCCNARFQGVLGFLPRRIIIEEFFAPQRLELAASSWSDTVAYNENTGSKLTLEINRDVRSNDTYKHDLIVTLSVRWDQLDRFLGHRLEFTFNDISNLSIQWNGESIGFSRTITQQDHSEAIAKTSSDGDDLLRQLIQGGVECWYIATALSVEDD